jgi:hypothetical protein
MYSICHSSCFSQCLCGCPFTTSFKIYYRKLLCFILLIQDYLKKHVFIAMPYHVIMCVCKNKNKNKLHTKNITYVILPMFFHLYVHIYYISKNIHTHTHTYPVENISSILFFLLTTKVLQKLYIHHKSSLCMCTQEDTMCGTKFYHLHHPSRYCTCQPILYCVRGLKEITCKPYSEISSIIFVTIL